MTAFQVLEWLPGRLFLVVLGTGLCWHYFAMSVAAKRAPHWLKVSYALASTSGFMVVIMALLPGVDALLIALWSAAIGAGAALVVALAVWDAGVHVCEVMDHQAAVIASKKVQAVVGSASHEARVVAERMTPRTWEALANSEQDPRDQRRSANDGGR